MRLYYWNLLNFLVFCLLLYFILQIFAKYKYFIKEDILVYQNLLAIASFVLIFYSFFPIAIIEYTTFTSDPIIILTSNIVLHTLIILVTFIISLYILGIRYFYGKSPKSFRIYIVVISFLIELVIFTLINFRNFLVLDFISFSIGNWECKCGRLKGVDNSRRRCNGCGTLLPGACPRPRPHPSRSTPRRQDS